MKDDHEEQRKSDVAKIISSRHSKKVVVAGPGTGKSFLFEELIKNKKREGKTNFLAVTFIGKLGDALADDLAGLATTVTLHGLARELVLGDRSEEWQYVPEISSIIKHDLATQGIDSAEIGVNEYKERTEYYKAVGQDDIVHYAVQMFENDAKKIPSYDLVLIDEFQDFNEVESKFIEFLATKSEIVIVGDDDQALYEFKSSSPRFIRGVFHDTNTDYESHTLRFCSRCTEVIVKSFHNIVQHFDLNNITSERIQKEYISYMPGKKDDSDQNPKVVVMKEVAPGLLPTKIYNELVKILRTQKIKSVLIIGEGRSCKTILANLGRQLQEKGFRNIDYKSDSSKVYKLKNYLIEGYKVLATAKNDLLAWRLIIEDLDDTSKDAIISNSYIDPSGFISAIPSTLKAQSTQNSKTLKGILSKPKSGRDSIADSSIEKLKEAIAIEKKTDRDILLNQLVVDFRYLARPLANLEITVTNILGSKGLGADIVFLVGFDQGKIPATDDVQLSEIYQMLVALTRAKKRIYLINTKNKPMSKFLEAINGDNYQVVS